MRISRFYLAHPLASGQQVDLPEQTAHHVQRVLRLKAGDALRVFNGDGQEYDAHILSADKRRVTIEVGTTSAPGRESPLSIHLGLGLSRGERMDYGLQKATELGVTSITPLFSDRSEVKLDGQRLEKRLAHWRQVAISATEQCGRLCPPEINAPVRLKDWVQQAASPWKFICDHRQSAPLPSQQQIDELTLLIGPEGGFSEEEVTCSHTAGFTGIALGPRVFRTETAPVATLAVMQWLWGDFR